MAQERKENNDGNIRVVKFSSVELPKFVEKNDKAYVYYGLKNDYPEYLLKLYNKSTKHHAVVDGKLRYTFGQGWTIDTKGIAPLQVAQLTALTQSVNEYGEDMDEMTIKPMLDWFIYGGFALEVIWNKAGTKLTSVSHVPFGNVRKSKDKENVEYYATSEWYKTTASGARTLNQTPEQAEDFTVYEPFDPNEPSKSPQLFYYKSYSPGMEVYPLPEYQSRIAFIEIDIGISTFWNSLIKRGFTASHIISFFSDDKPTDEGKQAIEDKVNELFGGAFSEEAGGFIVEFAADKDHQAQVNTLQPTDMDKQYDLLNKTTEEAIFTGINPMLLGIKTPGQLGGRTELIEANELWQNSYVSHKQKEFEDAINWVFTPFGMMERLKLVPLEPIGYMFSENIIKELLPAQALREMIANKMGIDLKKYQDNPQPVQVNTPGTNFSKDRPYELSTELFEGLGEPADDYEELFSMPMEGEGKTLDDFETEVFSKFEAFAKKLDSNQLAILDLLKKDPLTTPEVIAKVLKKDVPYVNNTIKTLTKSGHITEGSVTKKGTDSVKRSDVKTEDIFVKYRYGWNPITDNTDKSTTRPFCKFLLDEKKLYTRKEIEGLNAKIQGSDTYKDAYGDLPINVWEHRGGWYRKPNTDVSVPQCRHIWDVTVQRKKA